MAYSSSKPAPAANYSVSKLALRYGSIGGVLMIAYFLIFNALKLQAYQAVRFSSYVFLIGAAVFALRAFKRHARRPAPYIPGLGLGLGVGFIGSLYLAAFMLLYAGVLHPAYQAELQNQPYFNMPMSLVALAVTIVLLGVILGGLVSFTSMMTEDGDGGDVEENELNKLSN